MKFLYKLSLFTSITLMLCGVARAEDQKKLTFPEVWRAFYQESFAVKAKQAEVRSTEINSDRVSRHWYPTVGIEAKSFYTNDPGASLFSKLGERSIDGTDFSPDVMNYPETERHEKASLAAKLMLYEGGAKVSQNRAVHAELEAQQHGEQAITVAEFSRALRLYGSLVVLQRKKEALTPLKSIVEATISRYQVGSSKNPLGYSGLLGLKNLKYRIDGELGMLAAQRKALIETFHVIANLPSSDWQPASLDIATLFKNDVDPGSRIEIGPSFAVQAGLKASQAASFAADAERARFLPQVGVFAQQDFYNNEDTNFSNSRTVGLFMNWQLFSASDYGAVSQARAISLVHKFKAENEDREQKAKRTQNDISIAALLEQIKLADESLKLLEEQTEVTRKLFTNGLINALQLTEVYSRRVEVIVARSMMEDNVLGLKAESINYQPYDIDQK